MLTEGKHITEERRHQRVHRYSVEMFHFVQHDIVLPEKIIVESPSFNVMLTERKHLTDGLRDQWNRRYHVELFTELALER